MRRWLLLIVCAGCGATSHDSGDGGTGPRDTGSGAGGATTAGSGGSGSGGSPGGGSGGQGGTVGGAAIQIDAGARGGAIHPEIYGLAFADAATLTALNVPLNRWGGNAVTMYNWQLDTHNLANDYFFENVANNPNDATYGTANYMSSADSFVATNNGAHAATLMTVPTIGWTPKDRVANHPFTCGFPVSRYGAEQSVDPYDKNCGNGMTTSGTMLATDPTNVALAAPPSFEAGWLAHLTGKFGTTSGTATGPGVRFYQLDNEMMLWDSTHREVRASPVSYADVWNATLSYAPVIRQADPAAMILGYTSWGVLDLFNSGLDSANGNLDDQKAHGNVPLAQWYLQQLASYEQSSGQHLVDCLDLHYYPQGGDPLQNTASLWDPTYHDPSWIDNWLGQPVRLLPRLNEWIAAARPGTAICVSEYNFNLNGETDPLAALVEADVLGIFGKYGVRLAAYWTTPVDNQDKLLPPAQAFRMYRNYDGAGATFGTVSVGAASTVAGVAAFAAVDDAGSKLTIVLINKNTAAASTSLSIANFGAASSAHMYRYVAQTGSTLTKGADLALAAGGPTALSLPAHSMTLFVVGKP
jgi:hypothetical protein